MTLFYSLSATPAVCAEMVVSLNVFPSRLLFLLTRCCISCGVITNFRSLKYYETARNVKFSILQCESLVGTS